ncbi:hypothetical protein U9M48_030916 [Paspalum notatum var. saurae]|uniref:RING-type domain-containing protein n=1 Tax=Paspalum notatum var. saurae TaxID=547442 RepID=A0AAQ3X3U0_PASNO
MAAQASAEDDWWQLSREEVRRRTRDAWAASVLEDLDLRVGDGDDDDAASYCVPASGKAIWELHAPAWGEASEEDRRRGCVVCLEGLEVGQNLRMVPCGHSFHELCIFKWLVVHRLCPICQFAMPSEEEQRLLDDMEEEARQPVRKKKKMLMQ